MKPENASKTLLAITKAKAKMYEYDVPEEHHIDISNRPDLVSLTDITIGIIGDLCAESGKQDVSQSYYDLIFSAQYFDSLLNTKLLTEHADYLKFLSGVAYYLAGLPGSARVLLRNQQALNLNAGNLEVFILAFVLKTKIDIRQTLNNIYVEYLTQIIEDWNTFLDTGERTESLYKQSQAIRFFAYSDGSDRELLFADILCAVLKRAVETSAWTLLPKYTQIDVSEWASYLRTPTAIKEFWPSQILLGEAGVFKGKSAVLQMPTSSGKTKASELIIRSAFLSSRARLAVIIAPFRALCQEISNTLTFQFRNDQNIFINLISDVLQQDIEESSQQHEVFIATPEKFDYLLKHNPELSDRIGLIIYDEAHLFDDPGRGVKYELLLSSLKDKIETSAQVVVISAVMPNAEEIGSWLIGDNSVVVKSNGVGVAEKRAAFVSWKDQLGRLEFMNQEDISVNDFFVPRVLESHKLEKKGREIKDRYFPSKESGVYDVNHIALFLGMKLVKNGMVAIFTGRKDSVASIVNDVVEAFNRGLGMPKPSEYCDPDELRKLINYTEKVLGTSSYQAEGAHLGIFAHHGSIPHGLRLALEYGLSEQMIKFVICTSTLAQGVNLPIKYLIVANERPGRDNIKTRDFHNLIGRTGRSGFYTEGTIIFANTEIYDKKINRNENWRWKNVQDLINPENSENCVSHLLKIIDDTPPTNELKLQEWQREKDDISKEIKLYLLSALADINIEEADPIITELVKGTLAYHQASDDDKVRLTNTFKLLAKEVFDQEQSSDKRKVFAKTIVDIEQSQLILEYLSNIQTSFTKGLTPEGLLDLIWPILYSSSKNKILKAFSEQNSLALCKLWISGSGLPFIKTEADQHWSGRKQLTIDNIVDLCESGFGYDICLIIASCIELISLININEVAIGSFLTLQKRVKYGLPFATQVTLYEIGLADRNLSQEISSLIKIGNASKRSELIRALINQKNEIGNYISENYPEYFSRKVKEIIRG